MDITENIGTHEDKAIPAPSAGSYTKTVGGGWTKCDNSQDVHPARPVTGSSSRSVIVPRSSSSTSSSPSPIHHNNRAYGRPDVWVGPSNGGPKGKASRSWRPKQSSNSCCGPNAEDDASFFDGSIHSSPTVMMMNVVHPSDATGPNTAIDSSYLNCPERMEVNLHHQDEVVDSSPRGKVISTRPKQALDCSIHSILTEESNSRFSDARDLWNSVASMDVSKHRGINAESPIRHEMLSPSKRIANYRAAWITASKPPKTIEQEESDAGTDNDDDDDITVSPREPTASKIPWNRGNLKTIQKKPPMKALPFRPAHAAYSNPMKDDKDDVDDEEKTVPCLDESVTSLSNHLNDSNHSFKTCMTSMSTSSSLVGDLSYYQKATSRERGFRPHEMLPLTPVSGSNKHGDENGGSFRRSIGSLPSSSLVSPKIIHGHRAHSRPDDWVGQRGKPAKKGWKVKRIIEASEIVSDDGDQQ